MVHLFAVSATLDVIIQSHEMPSAADREIDSPWLARLLSTCASMM